MAKGSLANYMLLHKKLMEQHSSTSHKAYPWEHWPKDDGRSECGYVGLTNLGNIIVFFFISELLFERPVCAVSECLSVCLSVFLQKNFLMVAHIKKS